MKVKKVLLLGITTLLTLSNVACSSSGNIDHSSGNSDEKRTITWMSWRPDWPVMELIAADYMAENPDVEIKFEFNPDNTAYYQQIQILAGSNELPELFESDANTMLQEIAATGTLVDVDLLLDEIRYDKMTELGLNYARMDDDKLYSLNWESNFEIFWYHKELFEQAGITKEPETFDEFLEVCQKLKDSGVIPVATFPGWGALRYLSFLPYRMTGNEFIEKLKVGEASMTNPVGMQAAEFFQTMGTEYFQPGWSASDYTAALELFLSKNAAIYNTGNWQFISFLDEDTREIAEGYDFFLLPTVEGAVNGENSMVAHAGIGTSINKGKCDNQVKEFLQYVLEVYPEKAFYEYNSLPCMAFDTTKQPISSFDEQVLEINNSLEDFAFTWDVRLDTTSGSEVMKEMASLGIGSITSLEFAERVDQAIKNNISK